MRVAASRRHEANKPAPIARPINKDKESSAPGRRKNRAQRELYQLTVGSRPHQSLRSQPRADPPPRIAAGGSAK